MYAYVCICMHGYVLYKCYVIFIQHLARTSSCSLQQKFLLNYFFSNQKHHGFCCDVAGVEGVYNVGMYDIMRTTYMHTVI